MRRGSAARLCLIAIAAALAWGVAGAGAAVRADSAARAATTTTSDPSAEKNDFKAWIPIALGAAFVVGVAVMKWRRR